MIPKEPGIYKLGDYFQWVYFNTNSKRYDTLRSSQVVKVVGESQRNHAIESNDLGSFYDKISVADNTLQSTATNQWLKTAVNVFILLVLGLSVYFIFKKK
jgi:hypothetical protein